METQARRFQPDARVSDFLVLLRGMLFTGVRLDDHDLTLSLFMERLRLEDAEERDWIMMAVINIATILESGEPNGFLHATGGMAALQRTPDDRASCCCVSSKNMVVKKMDEMEVDDDLVDLDKDMTAEINVKQNSVLNISSLLSQSSEYSTAETVPPLTFTYALQLAFKMLVRTLRKPTRTRPT